MPGHIAVVDVGGDVGKALLADGVRRPVKDDQIDSQVVGEQELPDGIHRHRQCLVLGIAVHPGGDQGEGHCLAPVGQGQFQRGAVGGDQQIPLPAVPAPPDRPHGVDHMAGGQTISIGNFGLSRPASAQGTALSQQPRPGGAVDGAVYASAPQQALVGGVDDGVNLHGGDVVSHNVQGHETASLL